MYNFFFLIWTSIPIIFVKNLYIKLKIFRNTYPVLYNLPVTIFKLELLHLSYITFFLVRKKYFFQRIQIYRHTTENFTMDNLIMEAPGSEVLMLILGQFL